MKKVILFFLLCVTNVLWSQINNQTARRIFRVVALPITCNPADIVYKIGASAGYYLCTATDTWTLLGITGGGGVWGGITGTLSDQTDLQSALDAKASLAGATFTGGIITPVGTTTVRQFKLTPGVCLTSPNNGDFCYRSSDDKVRFYSAAAWGTVAKEEDLAALPTETGILRKTTAGTTPPITLTAGTTVSIAEGGTGQTAATDDAIAIYNGTGTDLKVLPNCTDTGGNHLNYTQSTNVFSCGTSGGSSSSMPYSFGTPSAHNPADGASAYTGCGNGTLSSSAAVNRCLIGNTGTIIKACVMITTLGTLGSGETGTLEVILNNTSTTTISAVVTWSSTSVTWCSGALSIAVVSGDYFEIKTTYPTFATNPTNVREFGVVYVQ